MRMEPQMDTMNTDSQELRPQMHADKTVIICVRLCESVANSFCFECRQTRAGTGAKNAAAVTSYA